MRPEILVNALVAMVLAAAPPLAAQETRADGPQLAAQHVPANLQLKVFVPAGSVRLVGWERDSIVVRGRVARGEQFFFAGGDRGVKFGVDDPPPGRQAGRSEFVVYLPKRATVSVKTVSASVVGTDVSGWFYSVSGDVRLGGAASSLDVLSMSGTVDLNVTTPFIRARTGEGHLLVRGAPQDVDASSIGGALDIVATSIARGQFASVTGDIHFAAAPAAGAVLDFSNHGGVVELAMPSTTSGRFTLSSVAGPIENGFARVRPAASQGSGAVTVTLGGGSARVTVRTFKGPIRLVAR